MLGTYRPKTDPDVANKRATRAKPTATGGTGPKTRSASTRRAVEQPITITYLGRSRTASDSEVTTSRSRRPSPVAAKRADLMSPVDTKNERSSSSLSSVDSSLLSSKSQWTACINTVNEIGATAKRENKYIRRLKTMMSRRPVNFEKDVAEDDRLTMVAVRFLSNKNDWSLNACHAFLPVMMKYLTSTHSEYQSIALNGLEAIADTWLEKIHQFATSEASRIGVDVAAEERSAKAKECIGHFREIVKNRDSYYKRMDENSIYKLDNILARLKNV